MPQKLILIRHGETDYNKKHRCQGHLDIPLNKQGYIQANRLVKILKGESINLIVSSDLKRAVQTVQPLAQKRNIPIITTPYLRERHMGVFQGHTWKELKRLYPKDLKKMDDKHDLAWRMKNGESMGEVMERVNHFLANLEDQYHHQSIAVATHGGTKRVILECLGFKTLAHNVFINNTDVTILEKTETGFIIRTTTTTPRDLQLSLRDILIRDPS